MSGQSPLSKLISDQSTNYDRSRLQNYGPSQFSTSPTSMVSKPAFLTDLESKRKGAVMRSGRKNLQSVQMMEYSGLAGAASIEKGNNRSTDSLRPSLQMTSSPNMKTSSSPNL